MKWLTFDDDTCVIVMPDTDIRPHGIPKRRGQKNVELAYMNCPCKPKMSTGDSEGPYDRPMIVHNSFEEMDAIEKSLEALNG